MIEFICTLTDEQITALSVNDPGLLQKLRGAEVVRCRDCVCAEFREHLHGFCYCMEHSDYMHNDDFCSDGERAENVEG